MKQTIKQVEELENGCNREFCLDCGAYDVDSGHYEVCSMGNSGIFICGKEEVFCYECKQKAKLLKEKIEKGCGKRLSDCCESYVEEEILDDGIISFICSKCSEPCYSDTHFCSIEFQCPTCQNLINRLNKIIGDEE